MSEWIKCSERMPDHDREVIAYGKLGVLTWMRYDTKEKHWDEYTLDGFDNLGWVKYDYPVTHWQELPAPADAAPGTKEVGS